MLAKSKGEAKRVRINRALLRSDGRNWQPLAVELIGTRPVSDWHAKVFPSDRFRRVGRNLQFGDGSLNLVSK